MEWRFELAEENLKVFVAALHCLQQVGKELALQCEATLGGPRLTLRALNNAHSAAGQIELDRSFFSASGGADGTMGSLRARLGGRVPFVRCRVYAKACCNVFRTLKHVRSAQLAFVLDEVTAAPQDGEPDASLSQTQTQDEEVDVDCVEIRWRLACDFDVTKTHRMKVHSCQIMSTTFDKRSCPSRWATRQHHLSSLLAHIHHTTEISVVCDTSSVKFESYFPNAGDGKSQLHTETLVEPSEFSEYVLAPPQGNGETAVQLIFALKEVKALLAFCKASDILEITFHFSTDGCPVLFAAESTSMSKCSIELTLATVTTFLPALSQSQSTQDGPNDRNPAYQPATPDDTPVGNPRYLTRALPDEDE